MQAIQENVLDLISALPHDWHRAGSLSMDVLGGDGPADGRSRETVR